MNNYNQLYDEETYLLCNEESKNILEDYQLELQSLGRQQNTINQYSSDMRSLYCWIYHNLDNMNILEMGRRQFRNFFLYLQSTNKSSARINRFMSSVRNMLEYVAESDEPEYDHYVINQMKKIKGLESIQAKEVLFIPDEKITYLINYLIEHNKLQRALYVSLSYDSCCRRNEAWQVTKHSFLIEGVYKTEPVKCKRGKIAPLMYSQRTKDIAKLYLEARGNDNVDSLWINERLNTPTPISANTLNDWAISFRPIIDMDISAHIFRHSGLENYETGTHSALQHLGVDRLDLDTLRILANHSQLDTTKSYLKDKSTDILDNLFGNN